MPAQQTLAERTAELESILRKEVCAGQTDERGVTGVLIKELALQRALAEVQADAIKGLADTVGRLVKVVEGIIARGT